MGEASQSAVPANQLLVAVNKPNVVAMQTGADNFIANAKALVIDSDDMLEIANADLLSVSAQEKALEKGRTEGKAPLLRAQENWDAMWMPAISLLREAKRIYGDKVAAYVRMKREEAAEAQRKLDAEAAAERQRLEAEAQERQRLADEEAAQQRAKAEEAALKGNQDQAEMLLRQADQAQERGRAEASAISNTAAVVVAPLAANVAKPKGTSITEVWKGAGENLEECVKAAAAGNAQAMACLMFNDSGINQQVKAQKNLFKVPGIRTWPVDQVAARGVRGKR